MDSDDVIMSNGLAILFNAIESSGSDVVISTKFFSMGEGDDKTPDENAKVRLKGNGTVGNVDKDLKQRIFKEYFHWGAPAGVYFSIFRRSFMEANNVRFRNIAIHEDGVFLIEVLCATNKIMKIAEPFYIYRWRFGSITKPNDPLDFNSFEKRVQSFLLAMDHIDAILSKALQREYGEVDQYFVDTVCLTVKNRGIVRPMKKFYDADPIKCWQIVRAEVEKRYGSHTTLLKKMVAGYLLSSLAHFDAENEVYQLRSTMKALKDTVDKVVNF